METVRPPPLRLSVGVWIVLLLVSPVLGQSASRAATFNSVGGTVTWGRGGGPSQLSHSAFPSLSQRPGPTSCDRKTLGRQLKPPGEYGHRATPATREIRSLGLEASCPPAVYWPLLASQALRHTRPSALD